jgi:hypothetical protein
MVRLDSSAMSHVTCVNYEIGNIMLTCESR